MSTSGHAHAEDGEREGHGGRLASRSRRLARLPEPHFSLLSFTAGAATVAVLGATGRSLGRALRPVLRGTIKCGIVTGRWLSRAAEDTRETLEDVTAEAREELARERGGEAARGPKEPGSP